HDPVSPEQLARQLSFARAFPAFWSLDDRFAGRNPTRLADLEPTNRLTGEIQGHCRGTNVVAAGIRSGYSGDMTDSSPTEPNPVPPQTTGSSSSSTVVVIAVVGACVLLLGCVVCGGGLAIPLMLQARQQQAALEAERAAVEAQQAAEQSR